MSSNSCGKCPCCLGIYQPKILDSHEALYEQLSFMRSQPNWQPQGSWVGLSKDYPIVFGNTENEVREKIMHIPGPSIVMALFEQPIRSLHF
jgi:hypothetical protein